MESQHRSTGETASEVREAPVAELSLEGLRLGMSGITPAFGTCLLEAASVCLEDQRHAPGIRMEVCGDFKNAFALTWSATNEQRLRCWADPELATEYGAYGVAFLLAERLANLHVIQRSYRRTGFDYWLGERGGPELLLQGKTRLEVSGVRRGTPAERHARVLKKVKQVRRYPHGSAAIVVVVEFGEPGSEVVKC